MNEKWRMGGMAGLTSLMRWKESVAKEVGQSGLMKSLIQQLSSFAASSSSSSPSSSSMGREREKKTEEEVVCVLEMVCEMIRFGVVVENEEEVVRVCEELEEDDEMKVGLAATAVLRVISKRDGKRKYMGQNEKHEGERNLKMV